MILGILLGLGLLQSTASLDAAVQQHDWFQLREAVAAAPKLSREDSLYYGGLVDEHFGEFEKAARELGDYIATKTISKERAQTAYSTLAYAEAKRGNYGRAATTFRLLINSGLLGAADRADAENSRKLWHALRDVAPSRATGPAEVHLALPKKRGIRIPATVNGKRVNFAVDSGANLSLVTRSQAKELGIVIVPESIKVGSVTNAVLTMNLGYARSIHLDGLDVTNVVFLVLDDKMSSIPMKEFGVSGILGAPFLFTLGETTFHKDGRTDIRLKATLANGKLCWDSLSLVVQGQVAGRDRPFTFDTGASTTDLYAPYFKALEPAILKYGTKISHTVTGVGGSQSTDAYRVPEAVFTLPGGDATLNNAMVQTVPMNSNGGIFYGNIGQDVIGKFESFRIDVRSCGIHFQSD